MNLKRTAENLLQILSRLFSGIGDELKERPMEPYMRVYLFCCAVLLMTVLSCSHKAFYYQTDTPAQMSPHRMESGELITQDLPSGRKTLKAIHIRFGTYEQVKTGELVVCLYKNEKAVCEWRVDAQEVIDNEYRKFTLNKPVRISDSDACRFTVQHNYTGLTMVENGLAVWTSPGTSFNTAHESGMTETIEDSSVSYFMTLEDTALRADILYPFLFFMILLFAVAVVLIDLRRAGVRRILLGTLVLVLIAEVVSTDLMQQIVKEIPIHSFASENDRVSISPGKTWEETFTASKGGFSTLEFSVSDSEGRSDRMHVLLEGITADYIKENEEEARNVLQDIFREKDSQDSSESGDEERNTAWDQGKVYYDSDIPGSSILSGGPAGKIIRIDAGDETEGGVFPAGVYHITITNLDEEKAIKLSILEEVLEAETAQSEADTSLNTEVSGLSRTEDGTGSFQDQNSTDVYFYDDDNAAAAEADSKAADDGEEEASVVIRTLNYALLRRSGLGYRIACRVILLLALYVLFVGGILCRKNITTERFFIISAIPLGVIYLVLMLPWNAPDARSHFLAANRFANLLTGKSESQAWTVRAKEAAYLPASWRTQDRDPYYMTSIEDYAYGYEFDQETEELLLKEESSLVSMAEVRSDKAAEDDGEGAVTAAGTGTTQSEGTEDKAIAEAGKIRPDGTVNMYPDEKMKYYSALNYLFQILGLSVGRFLGLGASGTMFMARIFILAAYIAACLHAIRITPVGKAAFALIALYPNSLMMAGSFSYDAMVLISTLCFTAAVLKASAEPFRLEPIVESALWAALIGAVKGGGYLVLLPLAFLPALHASRKGGAQQGGFSDGTGMGGVYGSFHEENARRDEAGGRNTDKGSTAGGLLSRIQRVIPVLCSGIASILVFNVLRPKEVLFQFGTAGTGKLTFSYAFTHPAEYFDMMAAAYLDNADSLTFRTGGLMLTYGNDKTVPYVIGAGLTLAAIAFMVVERDRIKLTKYDRKVMTAVILLTLLTTPLMLLSWTSAGARAIGGLQGRYYLPILPLILFVFCKFHLHSDRTDKEIRIAGNECIRWFCLISCLGVYCILRICLTR